jgi:hypothetical protein
MTSSSVRALGTQSCSRFTARRAEPVDVVTVARAECPDRGEAAVFVALGDDFDRAHFFALSVPDAERLGRKLRLALNDAETLGDL